MTLLSILALQLPTREAHASSAYYGGGYVMTEGVNVYLIFYGPWVASEEDTIINLASNIGGSPLFNVMTTYSDASQVHIPNRVHLGGVVRFPQESWGNNLDRGQISDIVHTAIYDRSLLPEDVNGVYFVLSSQDVTESTFGYGSLCNDFCGFHYGGDSLQNSSGFLKVAYIGDPDYCNNSGVMTSCSSPAVGPNGRGAVDVSASTFVHELTESITDPDLSGGWFPTGTSDPSFEIGDACENTYAGAYTSTGANVHIGSRDYVIQTQYPNLNNGQTANTCVMNLTHTTPIAVPGSVPYDFWGDGASNLLFRRSDTGGVSIWQMFGTGVVRTVSLDAVSSHWIILGVADFDGDGMADIFWQNVDTAEVSIWLMNGGTVRAMLSGPKTLPIEGFGDINGDGVPEMITSALISGPSGMLSKQYYVSHLRVSASGGIQVLDTTAINGHSPTSLVVLGTGRFSATSGADLLLADQLSSSDAQDRVVYLWRLADSPPRVVSTTTIGAIAGVDDKEMTVLGVGAFSAKVAPTLHGPQRTNYYDEILVTGNGGVLFALDAHGSSVKWAKLPTALPDPQYRLMMVGAFNIVAQSQNLMFRNAQNGDIVMDALRPVATGVRHDAEIIRNSLHEFTSEPPNPYTRAVPWWPN
jgi:hypothetical protein